MFLEQTGYVPVISGVDFESVGVDYFQYRQLKKGITDWVLLVRLGAAYMISGDYTSWSFGLTQGGWDGMFLAALLMATIYLCMCFSFARLSSMIPTAGGGYGFVRNAFEPWGDFFTGTTVLIEYIIALAAITCFVGAYCKSLFGVGGWPIHLVFYVVFTGIHTLGAGKALKLMFVTITVAAITLGVFIVAMPPHFDSANLLNVPQTAATGTGSSLPSDYVGAWAVISYAIWFFPAVEGVPLAAEETKGPKRDLPHGLIDAMLVLLAFATLILVVGLGAIGTKELMDSNNPLVEVLELAYKGSTWMSQFVNPVGLAGLIASFLSIICVCPWQIFALSRAGYLPCSLSLTNRKKTPVLALVAPGVIGLGLSLTGQGDLLILVAMFGVTIPYVLTTAVYIILCIRCPDVWRPYRTPDGVFTSSVALALACVAVVAGFLVDPRVIVDAVAIYAVLVGYFAPYSRHYLVSDTPKKEFAAIQAVEQDLR